MSNSLRPDWDTYFMSIAFAAASRSTCLRRSVGAVLIDSNNHIIGTGYNGVAAGLKHCNKKSVRFSETNAPDITYPNACEGASSKSGNNLDSCEAIHAEQNSLLQCKDVFSIEKIYCTTAPCITCTKLLLSTSCKEILFVEDYTQWEQSKILWEKSGRLWRQVKYNNCKLNEE